MKRVIAAAAGALSLLIFFSCGQENNISNPQGNVYPITRIGTQEWMKNNLMLDVGQGCYCYDDDPQLCDQMG